VFDNNQRIQIEEKERNYTERRRINDWHDALMVSVGSLATKTLAFAKIRPLSGSAYPSLVWRILGLRTPAYSWLVYVLPQDFQAEPQRARSHAFGAISDGREAAVDSQIHPIHEARIV
jgi:hypothetical protein